MCDNVELGVLMEEKSSDQSSTIGSLKQQIEDLWHQAQPFPMNELDAYRDRWKRRWSQFSRKRLFKKEQNPLDSPLLRMSWAKLYRTMRGTRDFSARLEMLRRIREFFHPAIRFNALSLEERRKVAGISADEKKVQWRLFGSMAGAIPLKGRIKSNRSEISKALDFIPWEGVVSHQNYEDFINSFREAFSYKKPYNGLATPTRLLALKRPDYFICVDAPNKRGLAKQLGISVSAFKIESYWELTTELIDTPWWNSKEPESKTEKACWRARMAMLDCLYYTR